MHVTRAGTLACVRRSLCLRVCVCACVCVCVCVTQELEAAQEAERKAFERVVWAEEVSKVLNAFPMP